MQYYSIGAFGTDRYPPGPLGMPPSDRRARVDEMVERLAASGATLVTARTEYDEYCVTMLDQEGNEFDVQCVSDRSPRVTSWPLLPTLLPSRRTTPHTCRQSGNIDPAQDHDWTVLGRSWTMCPFLRIRCSPR